MKLWQQWGILCFAFLIGACAASTQGRSKSEELLTPQAWELGRVQRMALAGKQAWERGNLAEAERFCVELLEYVDASTIRSLYEYASLLKALKRQDAEAAWARAEKLREAKSQPGSAYLGFRPSTELGAYAAVLREVRRYADAEATEALASAANDVQFMHFFRLQEQARGGNPTRRCYELPQEYRVR